MNENFTVQGNNCLITEGISITQIKFINLGMY